MAMRVNTGTTGHDQRTTRERTGQNEMSRFYFHRVALFRFVERSLLCCLMRAELTGILRTAQLSCRLLPGTMQD